MNNDYYILVCDSEYIGYSVIREFSNLHDVQRHLKYKMEYDNTTDIKIYLENKNGSIYNILTNCMANVESRKWGWYNLPTDNKNHWIINTSIINTDNITKKLNNFLVNYVVEKRKITISNILK